MYEDKSVCVINYRWNFQTAAVNYSLDFFFTCGKQIFIHVDFLMLNYISSVICRNFTQTNEQKTFEKNN